MENLRRIPFIFVLLFVLGCGTTAVPIAELKDVTGTVMVKASPTEAFSPGGNGLGLKIGSAVKTEKKSSAKVDFKDKGVVELKPESYFEIGNGIDLGKQAGGTAVYRVKKQQDQLKIMTPQGVTAVLGTVFLLKVTATETTLLVEEGKVAFTNNSGSTREVTVGQKLVALAEGDLKDLETIDPISLEKLFKGEGFSLDNLNQR